MIRGNCTTSWRARFLAVASALVVMAGLVFVHPNGVAYAGGDPTAPTLNSVNYSDNGTALFFAAPTQPIGTTITSYDYEISTDGGTSTVGGSYTEGNTGNSFYSTK